MRHAGRAAESAPRRAYAQGAPTRRPMGAAGSKVDKAILDLPDDERYYGLENFGNTCYANSVLQTLYFCRPFRERVLAYAQQRPSPGGKETLLDCLADLFVEVGGMWGVFGAEIREALPGESEGGSLSSTRV